MLLAQLGRRDLHTGLWPSEQLQTGETGLNQAVPNVFSEQCTPAVPLPALCLLSPNCLLLAFCFLDLLLCMQHVEGAPANIGHTLIVQQAGK